MKRFSELSIRAKLIRIIVTTTAAVLLPSAGLTVLIDYFLLRQVTTRNLGILAETVAYSSTAALAFDDPDDASRILQSLQAEPNIRKSILYDTQGLVFATYPLHLDLVEPLPSDPYEGPDFTQRMLVYHIRVSEGGTDLGWLLIHYDLGALRGRLAVYLMISASLATIALFAAYLLSTVFQERISRPILTLENAARAVSDRHDYNLRAPKTSDDEIGSLTDAFNEMLEQIAAKENALRISEERLRIAVEASRLGVWDWDLATSQANWLGPIYEEVGFPQKVPRQSPTPFYDAIHPDDRARVEEAARAARQGGIYESDFRLRIPGSGEIRHMRSLGRTFTDPDGTPARMVGVLIDVTDLRAAEAEIRELNRTLEERVIERTAELRRALNEIESFNYSVSHDLRAPLRGINGFSVALLEDYYDRLDDTGRDFLRRIVASCKRMSQLIDDLLELSRVTRQEMRREQVDLSQVAAETIRSLRAGDPARDVEVVIEPDLHANGDPGLLPIVLENLLQNAWKFTSRKPAARIEVGKTETNGRTVFFVRDNGAGFDMQFSDQLFGVFHRLHKSSEFEGTGIGLATVHRILERHGGEIWATGKLDQGATFHFTVG